MRFLSILVIVLLLSSVGSVCAQELLWTKYYGQENNEMIWRDQTAALTADGGYIIAGMTDRTSSGPNDIYLVRTDDNGDTLWTRSYGGETGFTVFGVTTTYDGGFVVTGKRNYSSSFLLKVDHAGDSLWYKSFSWNAGFSVQETSDSGFDTHRKHLFCTRRRVSGENR